MRIVVLLVTEAIHDQEGRSLQISREVFGVAFVCLLKLDNVLCKRVLVYFEHHGGSFGVLDYSQVVSVLCLSDYHHVRHSKLPCCSDKVFDRVLL